MGCQAVGVYLCGACAPPGEPLMATLRGAPFLSLGEYHGTLAQAITAVKRRGHRALGAELAERLARAVCERWGSEPVGAVFAVPQSDQGRRYRGFSLPEMLERAVCRATGWPPLPTEHRAYFPLASGSSRGLTGEQRRERMEAALAERLQALGARPGEPFGTEIGGALLILDDVVTTGTTLSAQVRLAEQCGWSSLLCASLASNYRDSADPTEGVPYPTVPR